MSKRVRKTLLAIVAVTLTLLWGIGVWIKTHSRDIPAPDVSDLIPPVVQVADEDNAYTYFRKAAALLQWPTDDYEVYEMTTGDTWNEARAGELLSKNVETLNLLQKALACSAYQPDKTSEWVEGDPLMIWSNDAGGLLALKAMQEQHLGRREQAWQARFDLLHFGSLIAMHPRCMTEYTTGLIVLSRGLDTIGRLLRESDPDEAELVNLADHLDHIAPLSQGLITALQMEFTGLADEIDNRFANVEQDQSPRDYTFQPNRTKAACAELYRAAIQNAARAYAEVRLPETEPLRKDGINRYLLFLRPNSVGEVLTYLFVSAEQIRDRLIIKCKVQCCLNGLWIVVACRLYETRHGRLPETLDPLVPELLAEIPQDPFDGKPFRYSPTEAVVYSVGPDLKDSRAFDGPVPDVPGAGRSSRKSDDMVYEIRARAD